MRPATSVIACCWIACVLSGSAQSPARQAASLLARANLPDVNPYASAADIAIGRAIYNGRCGHCHGLSGEGGRGAVLNAGRFRTGGSDRELFMTIRNGIPDTEMPGAPNLLDMEVWRMVALRAAVGAAGRVGSQSGRRGGRRGRLRARTAARSATRSTGREASWDRT